MSESSAPLAGAAAAASGFAASGPRRFGLGVTSGGGFQNFQVVVPVMRRRRRRLAVPQVLKRLQLEVSESGVGRRTDAPASVTATLSLTHHSAPSSAERRSTRLRPPVLLAA